MSCRSRKTPLIYTHTVCVCVSERERLLLYTSHSHYINTNSIYTRTVNPACGRDIERYPITYMCILFRMRINFAALYVRRLFVFPRLHYRFRCCCQRHCYPQMKLDANFSAAVAHNSLITLRWA
jgi:hypothetical protein